MAEVATGGELKAALERWMQIYDEDTRRGNDDELRELLANTLPSGDAVVKSAQVVSLKNVEGLGGDYRVEGTFSIKSEFRTNPEDPDTFGPHDEGAWKVDLIISAEQQNGEWRVTDVRGG